MSYKGRYNPRNPQKYKGNPHNVIYRSLWERKFMVYCDNNTSILEWGSEEVIIPYLSPWDGRIHRYFPDFYIKVKQSDDSIKKYIIEVKPKKQCVKPSKKGKHYGKYLREARTYAINEAKWDAAREFCLDRGYRFRILTEDHLVPSK